MFTFEEMRADVRDVLDAYMDGTSYPYTRCLSAQQAFVEGAHLAGYRSFVHFRFPMNPINVDWGDNDLSDAIGELLEGYDSYILTVELIVYWMRVFDKYRALIVRVRGFG